MQFTAIERKWKYTVMKLYTNIPVLYANYEQSLHLPEHPSMAAAMSPSVRSPAKAIFVDLVQNSAEEKGL